MGQDYIKTKNVQLRVLNVVRLILIKVQWLNIFWECYGNEFDVIGSW